MTYTARELHLRMLARVAAHKGENMHRALEIADDAAQHMLMSFDAETDWDLDSAGHVYGLVIKAARLAIASYYGDREEFRHTETELIDAIHHARTRLVASA